MKNLKILFCLLFCISLFACSSTQSIDNKYASNAHANANTYINVSAYGGDFPHTNFKTITSETVKKPLDSDHQLMMALLNRPMTADQKMMLAFSAQRQQQAESLGIQYANFVTIKGNKTETPATSPSTNVYSTLIASDINAIQVTGAL